jgi:hypothetical protein
MDYNDCWCFRCGDITNPIIWSWAMTDSGIYWSCNSRWNMVLWEPWTGEETNYIYGVNIPKQIAPVEYEWTILTWSSLEFSGDMYIGEVNKVWENNDTTCNNCSYSVEWDNSNFITWAFWDKNPNSCDVVAAVYGTGIYGEDITAYTENWTWWLNGNYCDSENMKVEYVSPWTNVLPEYLWSNVIYILDSGSYISDYTLNTNKCTSLIAKDGTWVFYSSVYMQYALYNNLFDNNVLKNIVLDWESDGLWWTHTKNQYWIYFKVSDNSTLYNIETFNFVNWIYIYGVNNTNFNRIISHDNGWYWLNFYGSQYNKIKNISTYNNNYGLYLTTNSSYNVFDKIKAYNNLNYGINIYNKSNNNNLYNALTNDNDDWLMIGGNSQSYLSVNNAFYAFFFLIIWFLSSITRYIKEFIAVSSVCIIAS